MREVVWLPRASVAVTVRAASSYSTFDTRSSAPPLVIDSTTYAAVARLIASYSVRRTMPRRSTCFTLLPAPS